MYSLFCYDGTRLRTALHGKLPYLYKVARSLENRLGRTWFIYRNWHDSHIGEHIPKNDLLPLNVPCAAEPEPNFLVFPLAFPATWPVILAPAPSSADV